MGRRSKGDCPLFKVNSQAGNIDLALVAEVTRKAMGSRSQKKMAEDCGYSTSAISQLLNCKLKNIEPDFAQAVWENREPNCSVTEEEFLEAFGMTRTTQANLENMSSPEQRRIKKYFPKSNDDEITFVASGIIQKTLLNKKYPILDTVPNYSLENNLGKEIKVAFLIKTEILENQLEWVMKIATYSLDNARRFLELLFAKLYVQSKPFPNLRYSVITFDRKVFKSLKEVYKNVTVDDYISVILLDDKRFEVADEFIMPRRNTQDNVKSIFI